MKPPARNTNRTSPAEAREAVIKLADRAGFDLVGVTSAEPLNEGGERLRRWQEAGMSADMGYMQRPVELLSNPKKLQKSARSVVSLGVSYYPGDYPEIEEGSGLGRVARYAWGRDYHIVIKERLMRLQRDLEDELGTKVKARAFTDAVPLLERSAAQRSGLGFFGRNACIISRDIGSFFFIADLVIDLAIEVDEPGSGTCGQCSRCINACPTGAIKAPGVVDARICISYLTIENRGEIPVELRSAIGDRAFGCDICQEVCPYNKTKARRSRWTEFTAEAGAGPYLDLQEILAIRTDEEFEKRFSGTAITRPGRAGLVRNCCVVAGNLRLEAMIPALLECLTKDDSPVVRGHAAWAVGGILKTSSAASTAALREALKTECDESVLREITGALSRLER